MLHKVIKANLFPALFMKLYYNAVNKIQPVNIAFEKGELAQELKEKTIKVIKDYIALTDIEKVSTSDTNK
ncbi:MAG: hypothetical protein MUP22_13965, partial [Desulfobacterales bacterium]|nr:hypothetical protein [Desulfobacterales bacterium]